MKNVIKEFLYDYDAMETVEGISKATTRISAIATGVGYVAKLPGVKNLGVGGLLISVACETVSDLMLNKIIDIEMEEDDLDALIPAAFPFINEDEEFDDEDNFEGKEEAPIKKEAPKAEELFGGVPVDEVETEPSMDIPTEEIADDEQ